MNQDQLIPPTHLMFDGPQDPSIFLKNGEEFFQYYVDLCGLQPNEKILDIGCGVGRKTLPLTDYLSGEAQYEGLDIVESGIKWCRENISARYQNFHFKLIDVYNQLYNPLGRDSAATYTFPFESETFDFVVLGSVFTHMLPGDLSNYLAEIGRVLKKNGRCLITYFLFNTESALLMNTRQSTLDFKAIKENHGILNPGLPEFAVGYDEAFILNLYKKNSLIINNAIHYGSWCGRKKFLSFQDIIVAIKK